ncbi:WxL domain-containing protein [Enterococcus crotali]|uniref:WxL domain-containing protein n=1 Tax=Enterococcus crotali TaxID=1453587 RepID=UPI00046FE929|nr:WxL domain-containing protein [Enterococcus crotali]
MRKKRKNKLRLMLVLTGLVVGIFYFTQSRNDRLMAAPPVGYSDFITTPGVNIIDINATSKVEISGDYSLKFRLSDKVVYEPIGASKVEDFVSRNTFPGSNQHNFRGKSQVISFNPKDDALYPERAVWVRNAGIYKGREIDLKLVIDKLNFQYVSGYPGGGYPDVNFFALDVSERKLYNSYLTASDSPILWEKAFLMMGGKKGNVDPNAKEASNLSENYSKGDTVSYHYEFYDSVTKKQINVKGIWNYNNINLAKQIITDFDGDFSRIFVTTDADENLGYQLGPSPIETINISGAANIVDKSYTRLDKLFQGSTYTTAFSANWSTPMLVMYETESLARIAPAKPVVIGNTTDQTHKDPNYLGLNYTIIQDVADNRVINRNNKFIIETTVPAYYDIDLANIKVNSYGNADDLTDLFILSVNPANPSKLLLTAKDSTADEFNGKVFEITVSAKPNSTFDFAKNKADYRYQNGGKDDGYMLFEQGLSTKVHYEVNDSVTGAVVHNKDIASEITDDTTAKVLYEGIPDGDPKKDLTFQKGTDFSKIDKQTAYLDNLRVDTENAIDEPVAVSYKDGKLPDSSILGPQKVTLVLTTAKGVTAEKEVTIMISDISATLTVKFIGELNNELHLPITLEGNTADTIDLSIDKTVQDIVSELVTKGYTKLPWDNPEPETATSYTAGTVIYKFQGNLALDSVPKTLNFGKLTYDAKTKRVENPDFKEKLIVSDTRANPIQGWHLTATLTSPMINGKGEELVNALRYVDQGQETILDNNAQVVYANSEGKDGKFTVSDSWGTAQGTDGIKLQMNSSDTVYTGDYIGTITWKIMAGQP